MLDLSAFPMMIRLALILSAAIAIHLLVRLVRKVAQRTGSPHGARGRDAAEAFQRLHPKLATLFSLVESALVFVVYFVAVGVLLRELGVDPTAYFATATVIGLAVGFGSQGLVQDVVIGLTLLFSDAFDVGDVVEISGQVGRVEKLGLRFTTIINVLGQRVFIPNRNIGQVGRFRGGSVRAFVDVQLPADKGGTERAVERVRAVAAAFRAQHRGIVLTEPELSKVREAGAGGWRYVRLLLRLWPGQGALVEGVLRQRLVHTLRELEPDYPDWKVSITWRVTPE